MGLVCQRTFVGSLGSDPGICTFSSPIFCQRASNQRSSKSMVVFPIRSSEPIMSASIKLICSCEVPGSSQLKGIMV